LTDGTVKNPRSTDTETFRPQARMRVGYCVLRTTVGYCVLRTTVGYCVLRTTVRMILVLLAGSDPPHD
jgi:hypothetical protein